VKPPWDCLGSGGKTAPELEVRGCPAGAFYFHSMIGGLTMPIRSVAEFKNPPLLSLGALAYYNAVIAILEKYHKAPKAGNFQYHLLELKDKF
jgi:hypothetical protein